MAEGTLSLGEKSYIGSHVIEYHANIVVGKYCAIGNEQRFLGRSDYPSVGNKKLVANYSFGGIFPSKKWYPGCCGDLDITIKNDVWIGRECLFLGGITIGNGVIIGARATITKSVPDYAVVVGYNRIIRHRFDEETIKKLLKISWWDWEHDKVMERLEDFLDVDSFIKKYEIQDKV